MPNRAHLARSRARRAAELSLSGGRELSKSERLNGLRDPVLKLRDRSSEVRSFSVRLQRIRISVSLFFPRCCSEATTRSRAYASARTTFGRGRPLAGPEEERTSPCPAHCPSGRDEPRPNSRQNVDARSLRRQPQLGHVIGGRPPRNPMGTMWSARAEMSTFPGSASRRPSSRPLTRSTSLPESSMPRVPAKSGGRFADSPHPAAPDADQEPSKGPLTSTFTRGR